MFPRKKCAIETKPRNAQKQTGEEKKKQEIHMQNVCVSSMLISIS